MNDARDTLFDTIYRNPLPATVTGVGLMWLLMNRSRAASERRYNGSNAGGGIGQVGTAVGRAAQQASGAVAQGLHGARSAAGDALDNASDVVTSVAQSATEGAGQAVQTVSEGASALAENARHGAKRVEQTVQRTIHDRPLAVGAAALAVGTMVACLLPHTEAEDQLMGGTRDRLLYRAGDAVHEAAGSVTELAEKALPGDKGTEKQGDGAHHESGARARASFRASVNGSEEPQVRGSHSRCSSPGFAAVHGLVGRLLQPRRPNARAPAHLQRPRRHVPPGLPG